MSSLRKATSGTQSQWTKDQLRAGFNHFKETYNRYPTAHEIDTFSYLPSARSIQRAFGGLVNVRKELFPEEISNFTTGTHRSGVAKRTNENGKVLEEQFYNYLVGEFSEIAVHEHKVIRPGHVNCDFYIYLDQETGVVIDIFYAKSIINLINVVNLKLKRYSLIVPETYLVVVGNDTITQPAIDIKIQNRKIPIPTHINLASEDFFKKEIVPRIKKRSEFTKQVID